MENVCVYVLLAILSHPQLLVSVHAPSLHLPPPLSLSLFLSLTHTFFSQYSAIKLNTMLQNYNRCDHIHVL